MTASVTNCCGDFANCYRQCDVRGLVLCGRMGARSQFAGRAPENCGLIELPTVTPATTPRRIGPLERLIAGPQGDPTLKADFYSFLGCIACGTGLALVLVAIVLAGRVLLGGAE